jgi:hypothetical protein
MSIAAEMAAHFHANARLPFVDRSNVSFKFVRGLDVRKAKKGANCRAPSGTLRRAAAYLAR